MRAVAHIHAGWPALLAWAIGLALPTGVLAEAAPATAPASQPSPKVWKLTTFLNGTADDIARSLNNPVIELQQRLAEKEKSLASQQRTLADAEAKALAEIRAEPGYVQLKSEYEQMRREVEAMRASDRPVAQRMAASSRMNRALEAMTAIERRQLNADANVLRARAQLRQRQTDRDQATRSIFASLQKQLAWRNQLVSAMRTTFQMQGPLKLERDGLLGEITPVKILGHDEVLADYRVLELVGSGGAIADGITEVAGIAHRYLVVIKGVETSGLKKGSPVIVDKHFRVTGYADRPPEWGRTIDAPLMLFRLEPVAGSDLNELFDKVHDFDQPSMLSEAQP